MSSDISSVNAAFLRDRPSTGEDGEKGWRRYKWLAPILGVIIVAGYLMFRFWYSFDYDTILIGFGLLLAAFLSAMPSLLCYVQNVSRRRQLAKLQNLEEFPAANTVFYRTAKSSIDTIKLVVDADYALPMFLNFLLTFVGFIAIFVGYMELPFFELPTVLLGGLKPPAAIEALSAYQRETFCVMAMAFIGSYVYALGRILDRINNNDLYPISIHYYTARIVVACAAAAVFRHSVLVFSGNIGEFLDKTISVDASQLLLLIGFIIGFAPDLFILVLSRKAFQAVKVWGVRDDPQGQGLPRSLPLLMIDDLTREKVDRLNELGIDSAQILARQNPLLLLPRLPFELILIVDWIAQAQLYVLVKDEKIQALRASLVRNILDLYIRLADEGTRKQTCSLLGLTAEDAPALLRQLDDDPSFLRLQELQTAMKPATRPGP